MDNKTSDHRYIAFDLGAESGRAIAGTFNNGRLTLEEIHRWSSRNVEVQGTRYWEVLYMFDEMKTALSMYVKKYGHSAEGIGVDTWGVDYGLINHSGQIVEYPIHYRDHRTDGLVEEAFKLIPKEKIYSTTGIQFMQINTLYQLLAAVRDTPEQLRPGHKMLMMGDLFNYFLCGEQKCEYTNASTTQLLDVRTKTWSRELLALLGLPESLMLPIVPPGAILGPAKDNIAAETGLVADVITTASHDTASAVLGTPGEGDDWAYISCGTWSLLGTELDEAITDDMAMAANFTNEGGVEGTIRFLKNIMGLWVFQEARRAWSEQGQEYTYEALTDMAADAKPFQVVLNVDEPIFLNPDNMLNAIHGHCRDTGQQPPKTIADTSRAILEGLALRYAMQISELERCTGKTINRVHMIGGGINNELLCQLAADAMNKPVIAGPTEATAMGNLCMQHMAKGRIADRWEARRIIAASTSPVVYEPKDHGAWTKILERAS